MTESLAPAQPGLDELQALPKVLLHDHLDGGLRRETILDLAGRRPVSSELSDPAVLDALLHAARTGGDLDAYLDTFAHVTPLLQSRDALRRMASERLDDLAAEGVVYAEVRFAPELHTDGGLTMDEVVEIVATTATGHAAVRAGVICSAMRTSPRSEQVAAVAVRHRTAGVVGFDLAGAERGHPVHEHARALDIARDGGLGITIHAGEAVGAEAVAAAIDHGATRIGHGVRIADQLGTTGRADHGPVVRRVVDEQVVLEVCPTSNHHTGATGAVPEHPITRLMDAGVAVTVNTDNSLISGVTATSELHRLVVEHGWDRARVAAAMRTAAAAAFAPAEVRSDLVRRVDAWLATTG